MNNLQAFLETSTIHGLSWISSTKGLQKLFWLTVFFAGFSGAIYLIYKSFHNWESSPISTTIETLPISQLTLPNITVCPPKDTSLNLNYDIIQAKKIKVDDTVRSELLDYALDVIQYEFYIEIMANLSKVKEENRFQNWYYGYTEIGYYNHPSHIIITATISGNISTNFFGDKFDAPKLEEKIDICINVFVPHTVQDEKDTTIFFNIKKMPKDTMQFNNFYSEIDAEIENYSRNYVVQILLTISLCRGM